MGMFLCGAVKREFSDIYANELVFVRRVLYVLAFCAKIEHS